MIDPLGGGRPILAAAAVVGISTLQMEWKQVHALEILSRSGDGADMGDMSEEDPMDSGEQENAASVDVSDVQNKLEAEDLVPEALISTDALTAQQMTSMKNKGEKAVEFAKNPVKNPALYVKNEIESGEYDNPALSQVLVNTHLAGTEPSGKESAVTESAVKEPAVTEPAVTVSAVSKPAVTESAVTKSSVADLPTQTMEPVTIVAATTKPSLRTKEPAVTLEIVTNDDAKTQANGYMQHSNNPLVFVALAAICCIFLFVWGHKRRLGATSSSSTSDGTSPKGHKVQYTKVPDEQLSSQDYDNEYCDDYEEDTFTNDRDDWDDWEGDSTQTQLNPFAAAPSAPPLNPLRQSNPSPYKLTQPLPPPPQQHAQFQESVVANKGDMLFSTVESNSSSDSFEVVTDVIQASPISSHDAVANAEKENESVDDLFRQLGMVLPFKKRVVVPPSPAATSAASVFQPPATAAATAAARSVPSFPTAAEASALFAAEMEDELTAVDAAEEWGEDDEWVKGI
ncbi:hypothetical protein DD238_002117 [Peronospora effusa]|uniref:Uncharacterized protein n=1 Tax=Peronospora effusa TaxID=542832 RepID=A0A3M6VSB5_9STRA|nr:hypothetical protein DD238_002117 [Peronospora effusa]RQM16913.1 hypothetical protein DD237_002738 [Peronospora effusa]